MLDISTLTLYTYINLFIYNRIQNINEYFIYLFNLKFHRIFIIIYITYHINLIISLWLLLKPSPHVPESFTNYHFIIINVMFVLMMLNQFTS